MVQFFYTFILVLFLINPIHASLKIPFFDQSDLYTDIYTNRTQIDNQTRQNTYAMVHGDLKMNLAENSVWHFYPTFEQDFDSQKTRYKEYKNYIDITFDNWLLSVGKESIIWGVSRGRNPTNFFSTLQPFAVRNNSDLPLEGLTDVILLNYSTLSAGTDIVAVKRDDNKYAVGGRHNLEFQDNDITVSAYHYNQDTRLGLCLERPVYQSTVFYSELSRLDPKKWSGSFGFEYAIESFEKSSVSTEYFFSDVENRRELDTSLVLELSTHHVSILSYGYDLDNKADFLIGRYVYTMGRVQFIASAMMRLDKNASQQSDAINVLLPVDQTITLKIRAFL